MSNGDSTHSDKRELPTPRTDALCQRFQGDPAISFTESDAVELAAFARQLERELADSLADRQALNDMVTGLQRIIEEERASSSAERLSDVLDIIRAGIGHASAAKGCLQALERKASSSSELNTAAQGNERAGAQGKAAASQPQRGPQSSDPAGSTPDAPASAVSSMPIPEETRVIEEAMRWYKHCPKQNCGDRIIGNYPREDALLTVCRALAKRRGTT